MPTVRDVLAEKGHDVHSISADASVLDATRLMNQHRIGALVVLQDGRLVGIFTERDVLTRVVGTGSNIADLRVSDVMTRDVLTVTPDTDLSDVSELMRERRIRHMPVCDEHGQLRGMVSIGDVNAAFAQERERQLHQLSEYVYGRA